MPKSTDISILLRAEGQIWNIIAKDRLAHTSIFGLCFMSVCQIKSNCYSLIYSSLPDYHFYAVEGHCIYIQSQTFNLLIHQELFEESGGRCPEIC